MAELTRVSLLFAVAVTAGVWQCYPACLLLVLLRRHPLLLLVALAGFLGGMLQLQAAVRGRLPEPLSEHTVAANFQVTDLPRWQALPGEQIGFWQFDAWLTLEPSSVWPGQHRVRLSWPAARGAPTDLQPGSQWQGTVRLRRPRGWSNEHGGDGERVALARGVSARGAVELATPAGPLADNPAARLDRWRLRLSQRLRQWVSPWPVAAAILPALVCGDRRFVDQRLRQVLSATGTAHLIAISGLHITLVAAAVWWLARLMLTPVQVLGQGIVHARLAAMVPALLAALGYAALAGFAPATLRALAMAALGGLLMMARRRWPAPQIWAVALAMLLLLDPLLAVDAGFWMSVTVVALLVLLQQRRLPLGTLQLVLALVPGPLAALWFNSWGSSAWLVNLLLVPLFSLVLVPSALLGVLLPGGEWLLEGAARVLAWVWPGWQVMADWPALPLPLMLSGALLMAAALLAWVMPWPFRGRGVLLLAAVLLILPLTQRRPAAGEVELVTFDVGQGLAMAISTRRHLLLFDTGPGWPDGNAAGTVLLPWLLRQPQALSLIFVSHGDQDHAAGLVDLVRALPGTPVYSGEPARLSGARPCVRGQHWWLDGVSVRVLWPAPDIALRRSNNRSCVVMISARNGRLLLTGDIERPVEYWLVANGDLSADILQLPHHGSATSNSFSFLRAVNPAQVIAAAGHRNRFGHPHGAVRDRLLRAAVPVHVTGDVGMLRFRGRLRISLPQRWRQLDARPWRERAPVLE